MFKILIFYFVFSLKTRDILSSEDSSDYRNACQLWNRSQVSIGLNTPSNTVKQKHFLIIQNYFCELEAKYNSNERSQFGITFGFKNEKHCRRSDWLYPRIPQNLRENDSKPMGHPYQCAFGVRSGDEQQNWSDNLIGLISLWTNHINYTLLPIGSDSLDPNTIRTIPLTFNYFIPTIAYNVYSRQNLNSIVFFEQKFRKLIQKWDLRVQVLKILEGEVQNVTDEALEELDLSPNTNLREMPSNLTQILARIQSKTYIPKAILQTDRSLRIVGLFGIQIPADRSDPNQPNGTIILFKKIDSGIVQSLWYCVTPEYNLSEECKSPEKYKLFIDCSNETFKDEEEEQIETTVVPEVQQTNTEFAETEQTLPINVEADEGTGDKTDDKTDHKPNKRSSSKLLMFVILIVVIIIVLVTCIAVICPKDPLKGYERRLVRMKSGDKINPSIDNKGINPSIDNKGIDKNDGISGSKNDGKSEGIKNVKSVRSAMH